jgi:hypothetical protein
MSDVLDKVSPLPGGGNQREYLYDGKARINFARLYPTSTGLQSYIVIRWVGGVPGPRLLAHHRADLMSSRTVPALTRQIQGNSRGIPEIPWSELLTALCFDVLSDHLEGVPPVDLAGVEPSEHKWLLRPLVGRSGATSILAPGNSGKSLLAMAAALSIATNRTGFLGLSPLAHGPVLYLDWEATQDDHAERMRALCNGAGVPLPSPGTLLYNPGKGTLAMSAAEVERICVREAVVLIVVDSVMLARQGDAFGPEDTTRLFAALREIGVPALLVDHKSREAIRKKWKGSYGSVVNDNSIRLSWEFTAKTDLPDGHWQARLEMVKRNNVRWYPDMAFEFQVDTDPDTDVMRSLRIRRIAAQTVHQLVEEDAPLRERVLAALERSGTLGMTTKELEEQLGKTAGTIRGRLAELNESGVAAKRVNRWYAASMDAQQRAVGDELPDPF